MKLLAKLLPLAALAAIVGAQYFDDIDEAPNMPAAEWRAPLADESDEGPAVSVWPSAWAAEALPRHEIGQVGGVAVDGDGLLHVFHRGARVWEYDSFDDKDVFAKRSEGAIDESTYLVVNPESGEIVNKRGANRFYMPHGLSIDHEGNSWLTDVAMHQVFKFAPGADEPSLVLGEAFVPGDDTKHFCKPTDVAVASNGDIFVADGYCNNRIIKFDAAGNFIEQFGHATDPEEYPPAKGHFRVPHSVALVEDWNLLCVADRENERIQCFTAGLPPTSGGRHLPAGLPLKTAENLGRVFAIRAVDHQLFGVTNMGLAAGKNQLFKVDLHSGESATVAPGLRSPHCLAVNPIDGSVFVGEVGPPNVVLKIE